ncbi:MAG TPA: hypothetical protein PKV75_11920 [Desulfobacterales bacterium]|nr:hypothetical protein [Desulfobacterales bacterium]
MKEKLIILLVTIFVGVFLSPQYAKSYGGGDGGGGGSQAGSESTTPPAGFEPTDTVKDPPKTTRSSTATWLDLGTRATQWVRSNPVEGMKNNVITRVPGGESCVEASKDRAAALADHIRNLVQSGEVDLGGHTVQIGSRSGYKVPFSGALTGNPENIGAHTYSVIQIYDADKKFVGGWEVDTYVVDMVLPHGQVDLVNEYPDHVQTITTPPKAGK